MKFDAVGATYRTDFAIFAQILDAAGEVVRKASEPYRLAGSVSQMEHAKAGEILFYRQPTLPPGKYLVEAAVHDTLAMRGGVSHLTLTVPDDRNSLRRSDLILIRRSERVRSKDGLADNPLCVGDTLLYPNLGEPLRRSVDQMK